jgi:hypothetical protein
MYNTPASFGLLHSEGGTGVRRLGLSHLTRQILRLWAITKQQKKKKKDNAPLIDVLSGRKRKDWSTHVDRIKIVPLERRQSIVHTVGMPKSALLRKLKEEQTKSALNAVKPLLTDDNK